MGSKVIKCNNSSIFTNGVSYFSLVQQQDVFLTSKKGRSLSEGLNYLSIIKGTILEASFYGFDKDKHRKFGAIMTEFLPHLC